MKKILMLFVVFLATLTTTAKEIKVVMFSPEPRMTCEKCENRIKGNLRFEKGVKKIETDLKNQTITVTYDADKTDLEKLEKAFMKIDFKVTEIKKEEEKK